MKPARFKRAMKAAAEVIPVMASSVAEVKLAPSPATRHTTPAPPAPGRLGKGESRAGDGGLGEGGDREEHRGSEGEGGAGLFGKWWGERRAMERRAMGCRAMSSTSRATQASSGRSRDPRYPHPPDATTNTPPASSTTHGPAHALPAPKPTKHPTTHTNETHQRHHTQHHPIPHQIKADILDLTRLYPFLLPAYLLTAGNPTGSDFEDTHVSIRTS